MRAGVAWQPEAGSSSTDDMRARYPPLLSSHHYSQKGGETAVLRFIISVIVGIIIVSLGLTVIAGIVCVVIAGAFIRMITGRRKA